MRPGWLRVLPRRLWGGPAAPQLCRSLCQRPARVPPAEGDTSGGDTSGGDTSGTSAWHRRFHKIWGNDPQPRGHPRDPIGGDTLRGDTLGSDTSRGDTSRSGTSGGDTSRGDTSRGEASWGDTSRGDTSRGDTSRGDTSWGDTSRGDTLGRATSWGDTSRSDTSGDDTSRGATSRGEASWGDASGGATSRGDTLGSDTSGGATSRGATSGGATAKAPLRHLRSYRLRHEDVHGDAGDPGGHGDPGAHGDPGGHSARSDPGARGDPGGHSAHGDPSARSDPGARDDPGGHGDPGAHGDPGGHSAHGAHGDPSAHSDPGARGDPGDPGGHSDPGARSDPGAHGDPGAALAAALEELARSPPGRGARLALVEAALAAMPALGAERSLAAYKALLRLLPRGAWVPRGAVQRLLFPFPRQHECGLRLLECMERHGVMPDAELRFLLLGVFGPRSRPLRKLQRMQFWLPRLRHLDPHPLPPRLPPGLAAARLGLQRMATEPGATVTLVQPPVPDSGDDEGSVQPYILSSQSPEQRELLARHGPDRPVFVEGPFPLWLRGTLLKYFVLRGDPLPPHLRDPPLDPERSFYFPLRLELDLERGPWDDEDFHVDEVEEGPVLALCVAGAGDRRTLGRWLAALQRHNPALGRTPVLFRLTPGGDPAADPPQGPRDPRLGAGTPGAAALEPPEDGGEPPKSSGE